MNRFCAGLVLTLNLMLATNAIATSSHGVRGYTKKDGTYVQPHRQTDSNRTQRDNWSSKPNVNPYTGKEGTKEPKE